MSSTEAELLLSPGGFNFKGQAPLRKVRARPGRPGLDSTPCISVISQVVALWAPVGAEGGLGAGRETL